MHVALEHLEKRYGKTLALDDVSLDVKPGAIVAVVGTNGAGKTTLLRALAGVIMTDAGRVLFDDEVFNRARLDLRKRMMFLPDVPVGYWDMTPLQHLVMVSGLYDRKEGLTTEGAAGLFRSFDILPLFDKPLSKLSRGQAYKAALCAMIHVNPDLWLLDEPFASGMDANGMYTFKEHVRAAVAKGGTVMYSTQILEVAEGFSDFVCVLHRGRVAAFAPAAEVGAGTDGEGGNLELLFRNLRTT